MRGQWWPASRRLLIDSIFSRTALRGQAILERASTLTQPFLSESPFPEILAKIKAVDGSEPAVQAYMDRYSLTYEERAVWLRHMLSIWTALETEYAMLGASEELATRIRLLMPFPDQAVWFENGGPEWLSSPDSRGHIESIRSQI
jgi:hypothetical protein